MNKKLILGLQDKFPEVKLSEKMRNHSSLGIGGRAGAFIDCKNMKRLIGAVNYCEDQNLEYLVIGLGTNILFGDGPVDRVIIRNLVEEIDFKGRGVRVSSGYKLDKLVDKVNSKNLQGMEYLAGIPGTVGGAIYGNAGAYGQTISDCLVRVRVLDKSRAKWVAKAGCRFDYRESDFKNKKVVVLEAEFKLEGGDGRKLAGLSRETREKRLIKYPKKMKCPGSFFKNVIASDVSASVLRKIPMERVVFGKIPAGYLLESVGANGDGLGGIKIADYHGNLFINTGKGTAKEFLKLANKYKEKVNKKYGIELEPEVQLVGFEK